MVKTAIVILNYNGRHHLEAFLPQVIQFNGEDCQIYIADNASTDDSLVYLKENHPDIPLILLSENLGFSRGYNEALQKIAAEYYILLNSDVEVTPDWTKPLITLLDENPEIAACQPKILSFNNKDEFEYAGAAGGFIDYLGYPFCRGRIFDTLERDHGQYDDVIPVFWATGACLAIRARVFHDLGGFDESFFAHMEEIDLCWRIHLAGYHVYYNGKSRIFHLGGGTLHKTNPRKTYLNFRNGLSMLYKNTYGISLYWKMPLRICLDLIASIKFLVDNSYNNFKAVILAIIDFFKLFDVNKRKKKPAQEYQPIQTEEIYKNSIVVAYFIKKNRYFNELKF